MDYFTVNHGEQLMVVYHQLQQLMVVYQQLDLSLLILTGDHLVDQMARIAAVYVDGSHRYIHLGICLLGRYPVESLAINPSCSQVPPVRNGRPCGHGSPTIWTMHCPHPFHAPDQVVWLIQTVRYTCWPQRSDSTHTCDASMISVVGKVTNP